MMYPNGKQATYQLMDYGSKVIMSVGHSNFLTEQLTFSKRDMSIVGGKRGNAT